MGINDLSFVLRFLKPSLNQEAMFSKTKILYALELKDFYVKKNDLLLF